MNQRKKLFDSLIVRKLNLDVHGANLFFHEAAVVPAKFQLKRRIGNVPDVYEGTIYTILRRLNASGYTSITKVESSNGPARKYYHLTETGQAYLNRMIDEWKELIENVATVGIRV